MNIFGNEEEDFPSERLINAASLGRADQLVSAIRDGGDVDHIRWILPQRLFAPCANTVNAWKS